VADSISAGQISIPAIFDVFMTVVGLMGMVASLYLFWSEYLPMTENKTPYGLFIAVVFVVSAGFFIFGARSWSRGHKSDLKYKEKKRTLELRKKRLENKKLSEEVKNVK